MSVSIGKEVSRFLFAGALNTALTYAIYLLLLPLASYLVAYSAAYLAGIVISYLLNTEYVFRVRRSMRGAALYPLIYVAQYLIGLAALDVAIRYLGISKSLALLASLIVTVPTTYLLARTLLRTAAGASPPQRDGTRE